MRFSGGLKTCSNKAPSFLAVIWQVPVSASFRRNMDREAPRPTNSFGGDTTVIEKLKFVAASARILLELFSCVEFWIVFLNQMTRMNGLFNCRTEGTISPTRIPRPATFEVTIPELSLRLFEVFPWLVDCELENSSVT